MTGAHGRPAPGLALALAIALGIAGCGEDESTLGPETVVGTLDVPAGERAPLDLAVRAGYGGVAHVARADGSGYRVRGAVKPRDSAVSVRNARTGALARGTVGRRGRFTADLRGIGPGATAFVVRATRSGRLAWAANLLVVRAGAPLAPPPTVVVPARDRTPPVAVLQLRGVDAAGRPVRVRASTPDASSPARPVRLAGTRLSGEGEMRDADGGALRVRVTVTATLRCWDAASGRVRRVPRLVRRPEAAIERLVVPPGRRLATVLRRSFDLDLAKPGCSGGRLLGIDGQAEADATNGSELEEATPIYFAMRPAA